MTTPAMPIGGRCAFLRAKLAQRVAELRKAAAVEKAGQVYKATLLANPRTMLRITAGNILMAGLEHIANRSVGAILDYTMAVAKSAATKFDVPPSAFREVNMPSLAGIRFGSKGFMESLRKGVQTLKTGVDVQHMNEAFDARRTDYGSPTFNRAINGFFDFVGAAHGVWYGFAFNTSLFNTAEVLAIKEGLKGAARSARVNELLAHPTDEMMVRAMEDAQYAAFRNKTALGDAVSNMKRGLLNAGENASEREKTPRLAAAKRLSGHALYGVSELFMPFVQMPVSIAGVALDYSPLGFVKALALELPKETRGQGQFAIRLARAGQGTAATFALGYALAKQGRLTGSAPSSPGEKAEWDAEGKIPNAVKLGGRWYSIRAGEPVTLPAILGANLYQAHVDQPQETGIGSQAGQVVAYQMKSLSELPMLAGMRTLSEAMQDPARKGAALAAGTVPVPPLATQIGQGLDPTRRQSSSVAERVKSRIPGASSSLPPRLDQFGRPQQSATGQPGALLRSLFDITQSSPDKSDAVTKELDRLRVFPGLPASTVRIQKTPMHIGPQDYNTMLRTIGPQTHDQLAQVIADPQYQALSDEDRATVLKNVIRDIRQGARNEYKGQVISRPGFAAGKP